MIVVRGSASPLARFMAEPTWREGSWRRSPGASDELVATNPAKFNYDRRVPGGPVQDTEYYSCNVPGKVNVDVRDVGYFLAHASNQRGEPEHGLKGVLLPFLPSTGARHILGGVSTPINTLRRGPIKPIIALRDTIQARDGSAMINPPRLPEIGENTSR